MPIYRACVADIDSARYGKCVFFGVSSNTSVAGKCCVRDVGHHCYHKVCHDNVSDAVFFMANFCVLFPPADPTHPGGPTDLSKS